MEIAKFLAILLVAATAAASEGVKNLDFEGEPDQRGRPAGWMGGTKGYAILVDAETVHGGQTSVRIERRADEPTDQTAAPLTQWIPAKEWQGKRVRLSGWLRTRDVADGWAALWMRTDSESAPRLAFDNMRDRGPRGTTEWKQYEVVLDVAPEATDIYFGILLEGNGTLWADDLKLEEVPKSVAVTAAEKKNER